MNDEYLEFRNVLIQNGIVGYDENDWRYLYNVAKICAKQGGIPMAAVAMAGVGSVTVPGIGAIPGYVAGALAGFIGGTLTCTIARGSLKPELDRIVNLQN